MNIKYLKLNNLYGYISKRIDFKTDITLLVGINGSGKTSILNILSWIVKPSIGHLCVTQFDSAELHFNIGPKAYTVICSHSDKIFKYELISEGETYTPLIVRLKFTPADLLKDDTIKNTLISEYNSMGPEDDETRTWTFVKNNFSIPIIIGLDRNLYADESDKFYAEDAVSRTLKSKLLSGSPLNRVKEIVNAVYIKKQNDILNLTNELKNQLILSAFEGSISSESVTRGIRYKLRLDQIISAETRVRQYFEQFEKKMFSETNQSLIKKYFEQLKDIAMQYQQDPKNETIRFLFGLNANQFKKVNKLLKEFEKFEKKSTEISERINLYIKTLNYFLKDSSKLLLFKEDTGEVCFKIIDKSGKTLEEYKDIKFLSSGEQQLLILFSYLAFTENNKLFIIDEPELSLHVKWQEEFIHYLEILTTKTTQVILATHSPILVGKKKESTVILYPYNQ